MKKVFKIVGWLLLITLFIIQFFRPSKNIQVGVAANHISTRFAIPDDVKPILEKACNDCHSNTSIYPWYYNIQPIGMWMNNHVQEGKREINFSEFTDKSLRFQYHKMEECIKQVKEDEMPINSYTWTHKEAILSKAEKNKFLDWAQSVMDTLKAHYPVDSLIRKKSS